MANWINTCWIIEPSIVLDKISNGERNFPKKAQKIIDRLSKENKLEDRIAEVEKRNSRIEELIEEQEKKLMEIAGLSLDDAREIVFNRLKEDMAMEMAIYVTLRVKE